MIKISRYSLCKLLDKRGFTPFYFSFFSIKSMHKGSFNVCFFFFCSQSFCSKMWEAQYSCDFKKHFFRIAYSGIFSMFRSNVYTQRIKALLATCLLTILHFSSPFFYVYVYGGGDLLSLQPNPSVPKYTVQHTV